MSLPIKREATVRTALYAIIVSVFALYAGQSSIFKLRFFALNAQIVNPVQLSEACDESKCVATFSIVPTEKYLLLGHVMRSHILFDQLSNEEIFPISAVRGVASESWQGLRVYSVRPNVEYRLIATKPAAVKMGYFIGIFPRSTNHEGVMSVPDISPTISTITTMTGFGVLGILLFAAFLAPASGLDAAKQRERLITIAVSSVAAIVSTSIGSGAIDSLMPDGDLRSRLLRTTLLLAVIFPPLKYAIMRLRASSLLASVVSIVVVAMLVNLNWSTLRAGVGWVTLYAIVVASLSVWLFRSDYKFQAFVTGLSLLDIMRMMGIESVSDIPPIYLFQPLIVASFSLVVADLGAVSVIALAARAYQRFTRDIALNQIVSTLGSKSVDVDNNIISCVKDVLPYIAQLTGAGRVSILVNLPSARPITYAFSVLDQRFVTHDDGKIPGAVTLRAFVYGDEAWFERYSAFSRRLSIPQAPHLAQAEYVCIAPIRVNETNMGVLMLTSFDDVHIERLINTRQIEEERETGRLIVDALATKFSEIVIHTMKSSTSISSDLLARIREAIPASGSVQDFLDRYCDAVFLTTGMRTMLHERIEDGGVAIAQAGLAPDEWEIFVRSPFNLKPSAKVSFGSTVVAFRERKTSYIKNWNEIRDKLHPKTIEILDQIDVGSFLAVPLIAGSSQFVVTMFSRSSEPPRDPGLMRIVESTEAIFDAAVTVFNQRTSVLALGKLANRLIGDDDVRAQIIEAAKQEQLQTTIGTARTSFLLLFDLVGSTNLPADTEEKARSYGIFYDEVNKACQKHLGGKVRKTIGDAVIVTWDGTKTLLESSDNLLGNLGRVVARADMIARQVGCKGVRAVLHHGDYFFGLIGTSSFGQIDVIGRGIDEVCKIEGVMKATMIGGHKIKIAISIAAANRLPRLNAGQYSATNYHYVESLENENSRKESDIGWACGTLCASIAESNEESDTAQRSAS